MAQPPSPPCGAWPSPLTAADVARRSRLLSDVQVDGGVVWWVEGRPDEGGRAVVCRDRGRGTEEVLPAPWSARSLAVTYGGAAIAVRGGRLWLSRHDPAAAPPLAPGDGRVFTWTGGAPRPLTPAADQRFTELHPDPLGRWVVAVREDHSRRGPEGAPVQGLVSLPFDASGAPRADDVRPLLEGRDLVSAPRPSPDGRWLAWLAVDYPELPWEAAELWLARLGPHGLSDARRVAGGAGEAVVQPTWTPDGALLFASDRDGWWNLWRYDGALSQVTREQAELSGPEFRRGGGWFALTTPGRAVAAVCRQGRWALHDLDLRSGALRDLGLPFSALSEVRAEGPLVAFVGAAPERGPAIWRLHTATGALRELRRGAEGLDEALEGFTLAPEALCYPTADGEVAHAWFYRPAHPLHRPAPGERPPLVVMGHGGPTSMATDALNLVVRLYTSRGFAVLDVNYRGSTGFGRAYRRALYGRWGVADVEDCVAGVRALAAAGEVDPDRVLARGGSAGGWLVLCLATFTDLLRGATSWYGISDLFSLPVPDNPLELHYPDNLVGPLPGAEALWRARSPLFHAQQIDCPLLLLHGEQDVGVPVEQSRRIAAALRERGVPVTLHTFPDEGHGFRDEANIAVALAEELDFARRVLGLPGLTGG